MGLGASTSNRGVLQLNYGNYGSLQNNGNVLSQTISIGQVSFGQTYTYDGLNRLATAAETRAGVSSWSQTYGYDRWGNRAVTAGTVLNTSLTPQSLANFSTATNRLTMGTVQYDLAGNLTRDSATPTAMNFVYDGENRQTSAGTTTYTHDGDGRRVKKVVGGTTNTYVYHARGHLVAEYVPGPTPGPIYLTADHLGSTRVATDQGAGIVERHDYLPYGEEIPASTTAFGNRANIPGYGTDTVRQKFTGMERDGESGADYFGARYHSGAQGRFTSPDPVTRSLEHFVDPQRWNRFAYVRNNPFVFVDLLGREIRYANDQLKNFFGFLSARSADIKATLSLYEGPDRPDLEVRQGSLGQEEGKERGGEFEPDFPKDFTTDDPAGSGDFSRLASLTAPQIDAGIKDATLLTSARLSGAVLTLSSDLDVGLSQQGKSKRDQRAIGAALHELGHADHAARDFLGYLRLTRDRNQKALKHDARRVEQIAEEYRKRLRRFFSVGISEPDWLRQEPK